MAPSLQKRWTAQDLRALDASEGVVMVSKSMCLIREGGIVTMEASPPSPCRDGPFRAAPERSAFYRVLPWAARGMFSQRRRHFRMEILDRHQPEGEAVTGFFEPLRPTRPFVFAEPGVDTSFWDQIEETDQ
jgi:hypothetical protein